MVEIIIATIAFLLGGAVIGGVAVLMQMTKGGAAEVSSKASEESEKQALCAVILCNGTIDENPVKYTYKGTGDCRAAMTVGDGGRICSDGCIGYGSCAAACPEEAITVRKGVAVIHPGKCTGCGECITVCPKNLIVLADRENVVGKHCVRNCPGGICDACGMKRL